MKGRSIVTRIVGAVSGIAAMLLVVIGVFFIKFETDMIKNFMQEYHANIDHNIEARAQEARESLKRNVVFNAGILSRVSAIHLYNYSGTDLAPTLMSYMSYPEIMAITFADSDQTPFSAAWKHTDGVVKMADRLPEKFDLKRYPSITKEIVFNETPIGHLILFYSEEIFTTQHRQAKNTMLQGAESFENTANKKLKKAVINQTAGMAAIVLILVICLNILIKKMILKPLTTVSDVAHRLAEFDLAVTINSTRQDEIGALLNALDHVALAFKKIVTDVKDGGKRLAGASRQMNENITTIASAAEEISMNVGSVSKTMDQMAHNFNAVAGAIEQMSASINEVGNHARQGSEIAGNAVKLAERAEDSMTALGAAAASISEVTEVIKRIADKTTLLAFNADIEAANAGDAGRGFAVVANEIKEFARQSTHAADDIAKRIEGMQESTDQSILSIRDVSEIIHIISRSSETISHALTEQITAADEIASNAAEANIRGREIALSMEELSKGAVDVSMNVGRAAGAEKPESRDQFQDPDMTRMDASTEAIARLAEDLLHLVERFKIG